MFEDLLGLDEVKAISLWQPWASLYVAGAKEYETRSWYTGHRGLLLIHAAKRWTESERMACWAEPFRDTLKSLGFSALQDIPLGHILGVVTVTRVYRTETIADRLCKAERAFGDYNAGRYAWKAENPRLFPKAIPYRGQQGIFTVNMRDVRPYLEASRWPS